MADERIYLACRECMQTPEAERTGKEDVLFVGAFYGDQYAPALTRVGTDRDILPEGFNVLDHLSEARWKATEWFRSHQLCDMEGGGESDDPPPWKCSQFPMPALVTETELVEAHIKHNRCEHDVWIRKACEPCGREGV